MALGDTIYVELNCSLDGYGDRGWIIQVTEDAKIEALMANGAMTLSAGPATNAPAPAQPTYGVLVLGPTDPVPGTTPDGTVIVRTQT